MKYVLSGVLAALLLVSPLTEASAVTIYDEGISGDLDAIGSTNVNLVAGVNTILGSINATPPPDTDRVKFTQAAGMTVQSIVLSFSGVFDDFQIGQNMTAALFNDQANLFDDNFNMINSGASIAASFFDSFGPETGPLIQDAGGAIWDFQLSAGLVFPAQPWTLTITTTQEPMAVIPLPAGFGLLLAALGGLGLVRRFGK